MIIRTGKFLDEATQVRLRQQAQDAANTPAILLTQRRLGPYGKTEAQLAQEAFKDAMNAAAVALGLPPPKEYVDEDGDLARINYGADFATGEVLSWEPDK